MKNKIYVYREGRGLVEVQRVAREQVAPSIRVDTIPLSYCSGTGQYYDSRSRRRDEMNARGIEAVESGYQPSVMADQIDEAQIEADIAQSINDVEWGNAEPLNQQERLIADKIDKVIDAGK